MSTMGAAVGNIIAAIIAIHMARKMATPMPMVRIDAVPPPLPEPMLEDCQMRIAQAAAASTSSTPSRRLRSRLSVSVPVAATAAILHTRMPRFKYHRRVVGLRWRNEHGVADHWDGNRSMQLQGQLPV